MTFGYANSFWAAHGLLMCQPEELCQSTEDTMRAYLVTIEPATNMATFLQTCTEYAQRMHMLGQTHEAIHQLTLNTWIVCGNISADDLWAILKGWPTVTVLIIQLAQSPDRQGMLMDHHWDWLKTLDNSTTQLQADPTRLQNALAKQQAHIKSLQGTINELQQELDRKSAECATRPPTPILTSAQASELSQGTLAGLGPTRTCAYCGAVFPEAETACPRCGISAS